MISLQAKMVKAYLRIKRVFSGPVTALDIPKERAIMETQAAYFKALAAFQSRPLVVNGIRAEWIKPSGTVHGRILLYLHGGAYYAGSIQAHKPLAVNTGWAAKAQVLLIDYSLAPERPFPSALKDAKASYEWLLEQGYRPDEILVAGDSAGGGLALALMLTLRDHALPFPAAVLCYSPWTDLAMMGESYTRNSQTDLMVDVAALRQAASFYLGSTDPCTPEASPLYGDLRGLPPLLIQVGSDEILLTDSTALAERAKALGVDVTLEIWPGMQHEWQFAANLLPEGRKALMNVSRYVDMKLRSEP
jgi:epsilon-lactone hydrolase